MAIAVPNPRARISPGDVEGGVSIVDASFGTEDEFKIETLQSIKRSFYERIQRLSRCYKAGPAVVPAPAGLAACCGSAGARNVSMAKLNRSVSFSAELVSVG
jgi:hypothetical protein